MTDCNREPLLFSSLHRQQVVADFNGGTLTSNAGGLLLREVDRKLGLTRRLASGRRVLRCPAPDMTDPGSSVISGGYAPGDLIALYAARCGVRTRGAGAFPRRPRT